MNEYFTPKIQGQVRHLLTAFGPLLSYYGIVNDGEWEIWGGVVMAIMGFIWSWRAPEKTQGGDE